jgi:multiple sugar transport system permease protein
MTAVVASPERAPASSPVDTKRRRRGDGPWAVLFLAPWLVGLVALTAGPLLASLYLSFTDYDLLSPPTWSGLDNYRRMFTEDPRWWHSVQVTGLYVVVAVPLQLAFALVLALALNRGVRGLGTFRALFYVPSLVGSAVAVAILWREIFGAHGLVNQLLSLVGIETSISWIGSSDYALGTLILLRVWEFGAPMVIFLAGLRQIPGELYEAAAMDGASRFRQFWSVTIPLLTPIIFFNVVLQLIGAFQVFGSAFVISGGTGGPSDSLLVYTLYLYQAAFTNFEMGYAAAMAWVLMVVIGAVTAANFWFGRFWVNYGDE